MTAAGKRRDRPLSLQRTTTSYQPLHTYRNFPLYQRNSEMKPTLPSDMLAFSSLLSPHVTRCDNAVPKAKSQQLEEHKSCAACMYTGMATCTGLSLYFFKMTLDMPEKGSTLWTKTVATNKRFLLFCSAFWQAAGIYRWHLG